MKKLGVAVMCLICCGCQQGPGHVFNKVLVDFGLREKPEGYEYPSDRVFNRLAIVGEMEIKRMNLETRSGEVKFQSEGAFHGKYYKEVKRYEDFRPLEVKRVAKKARRERGFVGYIVYTYRLYQSPRKSNRTEAAAANPIFRTETTGRETYRYKFGAGGTWDGRPGHRTRSQ